MRQSRAFLIVAVSLLAILLCLFGSTFSPSYRKCEGIETQTPSGQEAANFYGRAGVIANCIAVFTNENGSAITALATVALVISTVLLWRVTYGLLEAGDRQHALSNRAFVFIDGFNYELTTAGDARLPDITDLPDRYLSDPGLYIARFAAQPKWKNAGNTPTRTMTILVDWRSPDGGPIPPDYSAFRGAPEALFLAPKATEPSAMIEMHGAQRLIDFHAFSHPGVEPMMIIWGRASYEDVFRKAHFIEWCYRVRFERHAGDRLRASFIQWGDYNRSDEDQQS